MNFPFSQNTENLTKTSFFVALQLYIIPVLQVDNAATIRLAQNPEFHRRTKHIIIKHFSLDM